MSEQVPVVSMKDLMDAGAHFGHQTRRWNPKMRPYIYGERNGIHIFDLQQTQDLLSKALRFLENVTADGGHVLFVGTKKQAQAIVIEEATRCAMYHIHHRWLGGTLTNWQTVRASITKLKRIEKMSQDGTYDSLPKHEVLLKERLRLKLERSLGGIKNMPGLPSALFIIDAKKEATAIQEANRLGIPVVAVTDTNSDPTGVDFVIPGNDDSLKSIRLYAGAVAEASLRGRSQRRDDLIKGDMVDNESSSRSQVKIKRLRARDSDEA